MSGVISDRSPAGRQMLMASICRSLTPDEKIYHMIHKGTTTMLQLWWGAIVQVNPGDVVSFFTGPSAAYFEAVYRNEDRPIAATQPES